MDEARFHFTYSTGKSFGRGIANRLRLAFDEAGLRNEIKEYRRGWLEPYDFLILVWGTPEQVKLLRPRIERWFADLEKTTEAAE